MPSKSEENLYAILDAIGLEAKVGKGVLKLSGVINIFTPAVSFDLHVREWSKGIQESSGGDRMNVIIRSGDLGICYEAMNGILREIILFDLTNPEVEEYEARDDLIGLCTSLDSHEEPYQLERIKC